MRQDHDTGVMRWHDSFVNSCRHLDLVSISATLSLKHE